VERSKKLNGKIGVATLATHQFYTAKARPALAGTPICNLVCSMIFSHLPIDKVGK
jgi:hypothetical protein